MKLLINIPNNNTNERKYTINTIIKLFIDIDCNINIKPNINDYQIIINNHEIIIKDHFFNKNPQPLSYLKKENIPKKITFLTKNNFSNQKNIPIIYGNNKIIETNKQTICHIDIFASAFFMLTRWEETLLPKDKYNRCNEENMLVIKNKTYNQPIVNQYTELLRAIIEKITKKNIKNNRKYSTKITHDVDQTYRYNSLKKYFKAIAGDIIIRKKPLKTLKTTLDFIKSNFNRKHDPYNTFDFLMDTSEKFNLKSHFYFIPSKIKEKDARYTINSTTVTKIIQNIKKRNHKIGIHGSWNSFNNNKIFQTELKRLKNQKISEGRQHYLRFENPKTWQIWDNNNLKYDSTMGFSNHNGFRCGTCYEFNVFDIINRKKLNLIEQPLIFMDTTIIHKSYSIEKIKTELKNLSNTIKKYNGNFVFLWHPNNFYNEWHKIANKYQQFIEIIL